jgi:hypothetical protein
LEFLLSSPSSLLARAMKKLTSPCYQEHPQELSLSKDFLLPLIADYLFDGYHVMPCSCGIVARISTEVPVTVLSSEYHDPISRMRTYVAVRATSRGFRENCRITSRTLTISFVSHEECDCTYRWGDILPGVISSMGSVRHLSCGSRMPWTDLEPWLLRESTSRLESVHVSYVQNCVSELPRGLSWTCPRLRRFVTYAMTSELARELWSHPNAPQVEWKGACCYWRNESPDDGGTDLVRASRWLDLRHTDALILQTCPEVRDATLASVLSQAAFSPADHASSSDPRRLLVEVYNDYAESADWPLTAEEAHLKNIRLTIGFYGSRVTFLRI